jgi:subtilisin family serine protease
MKRSSLLFVTLVAIVTMIFAAVAPVAASPQATKSDHGANGVYIVEMLEKPAVAYDGGVAGYPATQPKNGQKIDPTDSAVVKYVGYLNSRHDAALNDAGGGNKLYDYDYTFNGFAAKLTDAQAAKMAGLPGVLAVSADELQTMDTSSTPAFLGLSDPGGLWDQLGGVGAAGDGIIIGMVDSGIWPESPSFSDRTGIAGKSDQYNQLTYHQLPGWHGKCTPGENFVASMCNQKLIGAQWFDMGYGGDAVINASLPWEFTSARDYNGHGTHTSSTAGGNSGIQATGPASLFGKISGMAPHARIAMYKALWSTQDGSTASGYNSDLVAAIDQAVADGVDVISYSISGSLTNFLDPVSVSFLYAANAGIFVSTSAGNSGPTAGTVAHPGPWVTTVAAGTHNRSAIGSVTLGNGATYTGASLAAAAVSAPLIDSINAGMAGASAEAVSLCYSTAYNGGTPALDPAKVAGKIVVCDRGLNARVDKSLAVLEAGGVGMILLNPTENSLNADFHSVPTVHLQNTDYAAVHAYAATTNPTATINKASIDYSTPAPYTASFSSRGPLQAGAGDLLKPDLMAPGQDILAAVSPASGGGLSFNLYSGTSMSAPHVAGVAALLKQLHPTWTPMMIKSALMTTAYDVLDGPDTDSSVIFSQGAGHIRPNSATDPGLVFNSSWNDWLAFLCGTTTGVSPASCTALVGMGFSTDPSNMNVASIAIGQLDLTGTQTVTRKVTNVGSAAATYTASYTGMTGFTVDIAPASLTLAKGASGTFTVTFTRTTAAYNTYAGGQLTWSDGTHNVRIPMVVRPMALVAPAQVSGTGGPINYNVSFGYTGPFTATPRGLIPAVTFDGSVSTNDSVSFNVVVPSGSTYARFSLFDANVSPASDLDLRVYRGTTLVGSSGGTTSQEEVNLRNPTAATYTVFVDGYATANPSTFTLFTWVLGTADAGNMTVSAPATATVGGTGAITLSFSGLTSGVKYLGSVAYAGEAGMPNPTIVRVDP